MNSRTVLLFLAVSTIGCGSVSTKQGATERDSAGVVITDNAVTDRTVGWTIAPQPLLTIGAAVGVAEQELYRVTQAVRLSDGRIAVGNSGTSEVRYYAADGSYSHAVGSEGAGPGEFKSISWLRPFTGDSLLVFDGSLYRFTVLSPAGAVARDFTPTPMLDGLSYPVAMVDDRRLVVINGHPMSSNTPGVQQEFGTYLITDYSGVVLDTLGRFPMREIYVQFRGPIRSTTERPFSAVTSVAATAGRIYLTQGGTHRIDVLDAAGTMLRSIRLSRESEPVTEKGIEQYISQRSQTRAFRSAVGSGTPADLPFPNIYPSLSQLVVDPLDYIWAREYRSPENLQQWWHVHDENGEWLGRIELPEGLSVFEIGADYLLGLVRDGDGVEQVRIYGLSR